MSTRHLVHPELQSLLSALPQRHYTAETLAEARAQLRAIAGRLPVVENAAVSTKIVQVPGINGNPPSECLMFRPNEAQGPTAAMLLIHGGGYINGLPELLTPWARPLAGELGCLILAPRYRLAPETPFPGPHEDCYAALAWLFDNAATLGIDPERIGVAGESAGGGIAASTCLLARDEGRYRVAFQQLTYPMIDDRVLPGSDVSPTAGEFLWTLHNNQFGWGALIGAAPGGEGVSAYCAPARAENLSGLPPTFIGVGTLDLFLEQDLEYARRLARAGVEVELHVYPGAFHGFDVSPDAAPAMAFARDRRDWLRGKMAKR